MNLRDLVYSQSQGQSQSQSQSGNKLSVTFSQSQGGLPWRTNPTQSQSEGRSETQMTQDNTQPWNFVRDEKYDTSDVDANRSSSSDDGSEDSVFRKSKAREKEKTQQYALDYRQSLIIKSKTRNMDVPKLYKDTPEVCTAGLDLNSP